MLVGLFWLFFLWALISNILCAQFNSPTRVKQRLTEKRGKEECSQDREALSLDLDLDFIPGFLRRGNGTTTLVEIIVSPGQVVPQSQGEGVRSCGVGARQRASIQGSSLTIRLRVIKRWAVTSWKCHNRTSVKNQRRTPDHGSRRDVGPDSAGGKRSPGVKAEARVLGLKYEFQALRGWSLLGPSCRGEEQLTHCLSLI